MFIYIVNYMFIYIIIYVTFTFTLHLLVPPADPCHVNSNCIKSSVVNIEIRPKLTK